MLAVSSGGGHWIQLLRLGPAFVDCDVAFVTVDEAYQDSVPGYPFYRVPDATRRTKVRLIRAALKLFWIICKERPDLIISTGAAPGFIAILIGKITGAKTIWLDSMANAERLSLSGTLAGRYADLWLTQWPELDREAGPHFRGAVL